MARTHSLTQLFGATLLCAVTPWASAASYGIFDARSLAMGGASVAAGSSQHAHFYNPALLSFEDVDENRSQNGRVVFPGFIAQASSAGEAAIDIVSDDLDTQISDAIAQFNTAVNSAEAAQSVLTALQDFDTAIEDLNREVIELDVYTGLSVSEPAKREGGSFYFGVRGLVFGEANVTDEDIATLDQYITEVSRLADGAPLTDIDPSLVNGNQLVDPRPGLTSTARLSSLAIGEWGLAFSKEFQFFGQGVAIGATPKILQVQVYREDANFQDEIPSYSENRRDHLTINFDLGVAATLFDNYRVGLSTRDVLEKRFVSQNDLEVVIKPRTRLGLAYINSRFTVGLDIDVQKNAPYADEPETQELALGLEWRALSNLDFRMGIRHDAESERGEVFSGGLRYQFWRMVVEGAFAVGDEVRGGALQLGYAF